jgi:hypothetical protein
LFKRLLLKLTQSAKLGERNSSLSTKPPKFRLKDHFLGKPPSMGISSQNTLLNKFSPVQRILTWNTPMDSARFAEIQRVIKNFGSYILGSNRGISKKLPS